MRKQNFIGICEEATCVDIYTKYNTINKFEKEMMKYFNIGTLKMILNNY